MNMQKWKVLKAQDGSLLGEDLGHKADVEIVGIVRTKA
jgi:hypothetical protein